jgi:hypothetical protein
MAIPPPKAGIVRITREEAARGQLESAILLWFLERDPASVHTLAVAAQELLHHTGREAGNPSKTVMWLKAQPKKFQDMARFPQNFFKHAKKNQLTSFAPLISEMCMIDAVSLYEDLFHRLTPLMRLFALRFSLSWPNIASVDMMKSKLIKGVELPKNIAQLSRSEFLNGLLPFFASAPN